MSYRPFGVVLRDLLIERNITTLNGNADWMRFARRRHGLSYETIRKAVTQERLPNPELMQRVARSLRIDPAEHFAEYRLWLIRREFDPREVGIDRALEALRTWDAFVEWVER
jgi:hypothetical protein